MSASPRSFSRPALALVLIPFLAAASAVSPLAGDWPQWRGPHRDGVAWEERLPDPPPARLDRRWRTEVGEGHSSPIVAGGRVFLLARQGDDEVALSLNAADGAVLWRAAYPAPYTPVRAAQAHGLGPKATSLVADGRLYTFGVSGVLSAFEAASGRLLWQHTYRDQFPMTWPEFGAASSPLSFGHLLIVQVGARNQGAVVAYEPATGREVWRRPGDGPGYASPVVWAPAGRAHVVTFTQNALIGLAPADGAVLWSRPFTTPYEQNVVTPLIDEGRLIFSGIDQGVFAARLAAPAADPPLKLIEAWRNVEHALYLSSPVLDDGHLYLFSHKNRGAIVCLDAADGRTVWTSPGRLGEHASLLRVGDRLLALLDSAELKLLAADPTGYRELAAWTVADSPTWAHPALADGRLYVKDVTYLSCFDFGAAAGP